MKASVTIKNGFLSFHGKHDGTESCTVTIFLESLENFHRKLLAEFLSSVLTRHFFNLRIRLLAKDAAKYVACIQKLTEQICQKTKKKTIFFETPQKRFHFFSRGLNVEFFFRKTLFKSNIFAFILHFESLASVICQKGERFSYFSRKFEISQKTIFCGFFYQYLSERFSRAEVYPN